MESKQATCQRTDTGARSVLRNFCGNSKRVDTMLRPNLQLRVGLGKVQLSDMSIHSALSISARGQFHDYYLIHFVLDKLSY
jgi:hypothetical protein